MEDWTREQLGMSDAHFIDHSGLEDKSQISAQSFAQDLMQIYQSYPSFKGLLRQIKPWNSKGKVDKSSQTIIRAKTGTLNFVSSLAGYAPKKVETPYALAILSQDLSHQNKLAKLEPQESPKGAKACNRRPRRIQHTLLNRWTEWP
jgi:D-alanyl-D-alanine carboxypeptidase/D-alanyl-D-alanine-endopeptidase (penicillin-binding protein 4)